MKQASGETYLFDSQGNTVTSSKTPVQILEQRCLKYGSTMRGRMEAACMLLGIRQKPPVLISEATGEIWFGTTSMKDKSCEWYSYHHLLHIVSRNGRTEVLFMNGISVETDTDVRILRRQMERCEHLLRILSDES